MIRRFIALMTLAWLSTVATVAAQTYDPETEVAGRTFTAGGDDATNEIVIAIAVLALIITLIVYGRARVKRFAGRN